MATLYSDQRAARVAVPSRRVKPNEWHGRKRVAAWTYTTPAGGVAINDVIELVEVPAGARLLGGRAAWEAMTSGAGDASVILGITGTTNKYLTTTSVDAIGQADFAHTIALNFLEELSADMTLIATATVEAWAAAKLFKGVLYYALD